MSYVSNYQYKAKARMGRLSIILVCSLILELISAPLFAQSIPRGYNGGSTLAPTGQSKSFRLDTNSGGSDGEFGNGSGFGDMGLGNSLSTFGVTYQVHITGEVRNPGTYRITASDRLQSAIQLAGGTTDKGSMRRIQIRRQGEGARIYDLLQFRLNGNLKYNPYLLDNDTIQVPLRKRVVRIVGAVGRSRDYELLGEKTVLDVIKLAGGLNPGASKTAPIKIIRYKGGAKRVIDIEQDAAVLSRASVFGGDVVYVPSVITAEHDFDYNVEEIPGEEVFYPSAEDRVFVLGGVHQPGPYAFTPYRSVNQYLTLAGGTTQLSKPRKLYVIRSDGKKVKLSSRSEKVVHINPGDTIMIPERRYSPEGLAQLFLGIVGSALSTTALIISLTR